VRRFRQAHSERQPKKGFQWFAAHKKGDDTTALVAHVKGIWNGEAAQLLKAQFLSSSTEPEVARPSERERSEAAPDVLAPLTDLEIEHPVIEMLGLTPTIMETLGGGIAAKGRWRIGF
jgi:hypothetical protein